MALQNVAGYVAMIVLYAASPIYCFTFLIWRIIALALRLSETAFQQGDDFCFSLFCNLATFVYHITAKPKPCNGSLREQERALCEIRCIAANTNLHEQSQETNSFGVVHKLCKAFSGGERTLPDDLLTDFRSNEGKCPKIVYLYGDLKDIRKRKESALCLMNHQTAMDWLLAIFAGYEQDIMPHCRFVMKGELSVLPFFGVPLHYHGCIFVRRSDFHQDLMLRSLARLNKLKLKSWMLIFAEGTRMIPEKEEQKEKSRQAAIKHNLPILQQVLTPHWRGSWIILSNMRDSMDAVYSLTFAYSNTGVGKNRLSAPNITNNMKGASPEVHIHVKRVPINEVPNTEADFGPWLHRQFVEKDKLMTSFYKDGSTKEWGPRELQKPPLLRLCTDTALYTLVLGYCLLYPWGRTLYLMGSVLIGTGTYLYMKLAKVC